MVKNCRFHVLEYLSFLLCNIIEYSYQIFTFWINLSSKSTNVDNFKAPLCLISQFTCRHCGIKELLKKYIRCRTQHNGTFTKVQPPQLFVLLLHPYVGQTLHVWHFPPKQYTSFRHLFYNSFSQNI